MASPFLIAQGAGNILEGAVAYHEGQITGAQLDREAVTSRAMGSRYAAEERRKGDVMLSNTVAAMASGGGGVSPTVLGDIKDRADYESLAKLFEGETEARSLESQADVARATGEWQQRLGFVTGGTMLAFGV
jgi:hypothetical protein